MKKLFFTLSLLLVMIALFAQTKPKAQEKPPTQKEMQEMLKEAQKEMDNMSPEDKKMMDSMGIKMPDMKSVGKSVSGVSDAQLNQAFEDENRIVPKKDNVRINEALATTLTNANMTAYINKTQLVVLSKLSANTKSKGAEILQGISSQKFSVANTAVGLWIDGKPTLALYLMGEACKADPTDDNNLNNYASFLTTCGAEQMALPILNKLIKNYPQNSTLYNNIAQAWLGLGDIQRAEKYADSAILIYAAHPQANMAKCLIEESKGNTIAAIEAAKQSIKNGYSMEKERKLKKLGYTLKPEDIDWDKPMPRDPMGLTKFTWPEYPLDVEKSKPLELAWTVYRESCNNEIGKLEIERGRLEKEVEKQNNRRTKDIIQASQQGKFVNLVPQSAPKAIVKLRPMIEEYEGNTSFVFVNDMQKIVDGYKKVADKEDILNAKQKVLDEKYEDQVGEGKPNPFEAICKDENEIRNEFLQVNHDLEVAFKGYQQSSYRRMSNLIYYCQYTQWPEQFELSKVWAQIAWLHMLADQKVVFKDKSNWCKEINPKKEKSLDSLQQFDDVACKYISTMNLGVYKITSSCSNLTGEFDLKGVKINIKDNVETGKYSGTIIMGISESVGPTALKAKGSLAGLVEIDNTGITNVGAIAGVSVKSGPVTIAGVDVKATINTGVSVSGKFLGKK